ncbi:MAG: ADOP family duplicated permease [Gemmatimonadales bacterium]
MVRVLELLLRLLPRPFRERFGGDMREQIATDLQIARSKGGMAAVAFTLATGVDLLLTAAAERWNPTWVEAADGSTRTNGVGTMAAQWIEDLGQATRSLRRAPGFTAVSVTTLGIALGALAGVFTVVDAVLLDPLPYEDPDRLVAIGGTAPGSELPDEFPLSGEFYLQYQEAELLTGVAVYNSYTNTLRAGDRIERVRMASPTPSLFALLGVAPLLGRLPGEREDDVALLSHTLWTTWFGSDPTVIGRSVYAGGGDRTIIGVMGPDFWFERDDVLIWVPGLIEAGDFPLGDFTGRTQLIGRLAPGATHDELVVELDRLASTLPERFGGSPAYARTIAQLRTLVGPFEQRVFGAVSAQLWILFSAVALVLLIACANVANLFFVRAEERARDVVVRRALGAGRARIVGTFLAEAVVVAALAGVLAATIAWAGVPALLAAAPPAVPNLGRAGVDGSVLLFTAATAALCATLCGMLAAIWSSAPDLRGLRDGGRHSTGRARWRRDGLVVLQTALGLVLLIGSALLFRSFQELRRVDPGYDVEDVYTFQLGVEETEGLTDGPSFARFHMELMDRIRALPGVESVGIVENVPLNEGVAVGRYRTEERADDPEGGTLLSYTFAGGDYWSTMGIDVLEGRALSDEDQEVGAGNVVMGRAAAERLWPDESAVGRRLTSETSGAWYTIVGVVEDVLQYGFDGEAEPLVYLPLVGPTATSWILTSPAYVVKTSRADAIGPEIREIARQVAPSAPMYRTFTMSGLADDSMVPLTFMALALGIASVLAMVLGAVGLYGVLSYVVAQRTREIGVRMALGAEASGVRRMVVAQGCRVVLAGVVVGVIVAAASTRALEGLLFGVEAADVATFATMSAGMVLVGMLASYLPARRASSVDPVESLKG